MKAGDTAWVISGSPSLHILRGPGHEHRLMGKAYDHGIMHGEAMDG
jgi:hypothetical protein